MSIRYYLLNIVSVSLTIYWQRFVDQLIASGRYNNQSEVVRAGLRALEERELSRDEQEFERIFAGGARSEPGREVIKRAISRQKSLRARRR